MGKVKRFMKWRREGRDKERGGELKVELRKGEGMAEIRKW